MSLLTLWQANPGEIESKRIHQLVAIAGHGLLRDGSPTSAELREFLGAAPIKLLERYLDECLSAPFDESGLVLQDLVNELGARLGCEVRRGLYRGKVNAIGYDGIWRFPDGYAVVVEVKTTDTYNLPLDKLAGYRASLAKNAEISDESSILIVVGRRDTGSLEAQVRGSRHAWDIRLISIDKLLKLVEIKEAADSKTTIQKIRTVLTPLELTRVDFIVDLLATTAEDVKKISESEDLEDELQVHEKPEKKFTPVAFHEDVIGRVAKALGKDLKKETRSLYASMDKALSVRAIVSRAHPHGPNTFYWYAFHPYYTDPLAEYSKSYVAFGCGSGDKVLLFDLSEFASWLPQMNVTEKEDRMYYHIHFMEDEKGKIELRLKGGHSPIDVTKYKLSDVQPTS